MNLLTSAPLKSETTGTVPLPAIVIVIMLSAAQYGHATCAMSATGNSLIGIISAPFKLFPQL